MTLIMPYQDAGFLLFCLVRLGDTVRWTSPAIPVTGMGVVRIDGPTATFPTINLAKLAKELL